MKRGPTTPIAMAMATPILMLLAGPSSFADTTAIVGATVHTVGPLGSVDDATIVITDGRIAAVGAGISVPDGADVIDAAGKVVTPGLFTPRGSLGLEEVGLSAGPLDAVQRGEQFSASFDIADAFNPRSTLIAVNRIEGVTRALVTPEAAAADETGAASSVISGLAAVVNLSGGRSSLDRRGAALVVNLGEYGVPQGGTSRAAALLQLRNALNEAGDYRQHGAAFELGQHRDYALSLTDLEALQNVLTGEVPLLANVDRASDIAAFASLVASYGIRGIVAGGAEAWMHAGELVAAGIPVILAPAANLPTNFDRLNARSDSAALLTAAGVRVMFADGQGHTHNARNITQSAGNAVVAGMTWNDALRAITLTPAEVYGVADRVGSIEVGKEADIVIWPGDPMELVNYPEQVLIRGIAIEMTSRQTLLRDRYKNLDEDKPPAFRR